MMLVILDGKLYIVYQIMTTVCHKKNKKINSNTNSKHRTIEYVGIAFLSYSHHNNHTEIGLC